MIIRFLPLLFDAPGAFLVLVAAFGVSMMSGLILHEWCHALVADRLGDSLPRRMGRLSLDPRRHYDPVGTTLVLFAGFGWAKPVPVSPWHPRREMAMIGFAGPLSNFVIAGAAAIPLRLGLLPFWHPFVSPGFIEAFAAEWASSPRDLLGLFLGTVVLLNVLLGVFNLLPIPPLDGSRVALWLLPPNLAREYQRLEAWGPGILMLLVFAPFLTNGAFSLMNVTGPVVDIILAVFLGDAVNIRFT